MATTFGPGSPTDPRYNLYYGVPTAADFEAGGTGSNYLTSGAYTPEQIAAMTGRTTVGPAPAPTSRTTVGPAPASTSGTTAFGPGNPTTATAPAPAPAPTTSTPESNWVTEFRDNYLAAMAGLRADPNSAMSGKGIQVPTADEANEYAQYLAGFFPSNEFIGQVTSRNYDWPENTGEFNPGMFRPMPTDLAYTPPPNYSPWGYGSMENPFGWLGEWSNATVEALPTSKGIVPGMEPEVKQTTAPVVPRYEEPRYPVSPLITPPPQRPSIPSDYISSIQNWRPVSGPGGIDRAPDNRVEPPPPATTPPPQTPGQVEAQAPPPPAPALDPEYQQADALYWVWYAENQSLGSDNRSGEAAFPGYYHQMTGKRLPEGWVNPVARNQQTSYPVSSSKG